MEPCVVLWNLMEPSRTLKKRYKTKFNFPEFVENIEEHFRFFRNIFWIFLTKTFQSISERFEGILER